MDPSTKDRILNAAEKLFADNGFTATSLRAITSEAGVNLAAVNYHFGSKEALVGAVFHRLLHPVNTERLARLTRLEEQEQPPVLEDVLRAFLAPPMELYQHGDRGRVLVKLFGRLHSESSTSAQAMVREEFRDIMRRFLPALSAASGNDDAKDMIWRFHFLVGALLHTVAHWQFMRDISKHSSPVTTDEILDRLVDFSAAGFRGPALKETTT